MAIAAQGRQIALRLSADGFVVTVMKLERRRLAAILAATTSATLDFVFCFLGDAHDTHHICDEDLYFFFALTPFPF